MAFGYTILGFGSGSAGFTEYDADYLMIAGGGPGFGDWGGGGAAGGYRTSYPGGTKITLDQEEIAITVGAKGAQGTGVSATGSTKGGDSRIALASGNLDSSGGGIGCNNPVGPDFNTGGSGGGTPHQGSTDGDGNIGGYPTPEGQPGAASGSGTYSGSGGGGASTAGNSCSPGTSGTGGPGGAGLANSITGASVTRAGGGGGCGWLAPSAGGAGGAGGGGTGAAGYGEGTDATASTGSGGGGRMGIGADGTVIIRIPSADAPAALAVAPGTNTIADDGGDKVCTFTVDGTLTIG